MRLQVLSSGSEGNSTLIRTEATSLLVDAGLVLADLEARLASVHHPAGAIDHVAVTHGHLDHARCAGAFARRTRATLHCPESMMTHPSARRAKRLSTIPIGSPFEVDGHGGVGPVRLTGVPLPHDCEPTVAFRIEHEGRVAAILTDMGRPCAEVARALSGAHVLVLEFNYDPDLMRDGPYPPELQRRITGSRGHLSNEQGARMLELLAGPELHTLVLAHLSLKTNRPELALAAARGVLARIGLSERVRVLVASQHAAIESVEV